MKNTRHFPNSQVSEGESDEPGNGPVLVNAETIGTRYGVTGRFILQLAAKKKLPCFRLGKKCVRFDPVAVAKAFDDPNFGQEGHAE
jgi:hypothetical protein